MKDETIIEIRNGNGVEFASPSDIVPNYKARLVTIEIGMMTELTEIASGLLDSDDVELVDGILYDILDDDRQRELASRIISMMDNESVPFQDACRLIADELFTPAVIRKMNERLYSAEKAETLSKTAALIVDARQKAGISTEDLASRVGLDIEKLKAVETGKSDVKVNTLRRIAEALGKRLVIEFRNV